MRLFPKFITNNAFAIIGSITCGIVKLAYNFGFFHNIQLKSAHDGMFDPLFFLSPIPYNFFVSIFDVKRYDPSPFFISFGAVGFVLGIYYSTKRSYVKNRFLNILFLTIVFTLCGLAFSLWLHFWAALDGYDLQSIPFYEFSVSFSVGLFVFIFCSSFLSMSDNSKTIIISGLFSSSVLFFIFSTTAIGYTFSTATAIGLVSYLIVLVLLYLTIGYHYEEYYSNIFISILSITFSFLLLPFVGIMSLLILPIENIYFLFRIIKRIRKDRKKTGVKFEQRITNPLEWVLSFPSILLNCTIYGSIFSIIPYISITQFLQDSGQLNKLNYKRSCILGIFAFLVHFSFFIFYSSFAPSLTKFGSTIYMVVDIILWIAMGFVASKSLSYCLLEIKNE